MAVGIYIACTLLLVISTEANCFNTDNCDFLNMTYNICNNVQLAKEHCKLFCHLCDSVRGSWSECDVTCGPGIRSRVRSCDNPSPMHGGDSCDGLINEKNVCMLQICPVHGGWSEWTAWGSCSTSCDFGLQRRDRSCDKPWPSKDGNPCNGDNINYRVCADALCTNEWTSWSEWSSCSLTCGPGLKHRHRTCNYTMWTLLGGGCIGTDQEHIECNLKSCDSYVLFYARGPTHEDIAFGETIVYGTVTIDKGGGYNSSNGVFTAPRAGLSLFISQSCNNPRKLTNTGIIQEGVTLQTAMLSSESGYTCLSIQAAVELRVGERVWVKGTSTTDLYEDIGYRWSSFSGMLIQ